MESAADSQEEEEVEECCLSFVDDVGLAEEGLEAS